MNREAVRARVLSPLERFSEIVFGLVMVLSFTGALSVAGSRAGRCAHDADRRDRLQSRLGIIDAAFYLFGCLTEHGRNATVLRNVQQSAEPAHAQQIIADALQPADFERIREHLKQQPPPAERLKFTRENWRGALGVFLLVFITTFPVVVPFLFIRDSRFALRISNVIAIVMLFGAGRMLANHAGLRHPVITGLVMVAIGAVLVALAIALGG